MADIIQLLPDSIANQIAAGEVIQRPASAVKELLENAIDAGADHIQVILKDAGKTLLQIIDNGKGMSETDARMCFERHATSKIRKTDDLFTLTTMGFRGEALASIAAIAQVELKTKTNKTDLGTKIVIEGSKVKSQEACQCPKGTSLAIKNLFYNVPARRNFLKANSTEMRHIVEEFTRIALSNPKVFFSLHHNNNEIYHLPKANLRQRIVALFGNKINRKLVPIIEETDIIKMDGFIGKPEFATQTRGEQFFYVNDRFIKSSYLHHALMGAYDGLLAEKALPLYVIFIDIDPKLIDVNVHPTKQEIKFEDERLLYNFLKVSVRHALGQYSITPTLDFDQTPGFNSTIGPGISQTSFGQGQSQRKAAPDGGLKTRNLENWEKLYKGLDNIPMPQKTEAQPVTFKSKFSEDESGEQVVQQKTPYQIHNKYIVSPIKSGFLLIDQQAAHERILYEQFLSNLENQNQHTQTQLFPTNINVNGQDAALLRDMIPEINKMGFDLKEFGQDSFIMQGLPAECDQNFNVEKMIQDLLEQSKMNVDFKTNIRERIAATLARSAATKKGTKLNVDEINALIDRLFACKLPFKDPFGRKCFITFDLDELDKKFDF